MTERIKQRYAGDDLVFYEGEGPNRSTTGYDLLRISPTEIKIGSSTNNVTLVPSSTDGAALGSTTRMFSDLFLASGGVINFDNGDVTLTHASNALTIAGGILNLTYGGAALNITSTITSAANVVLISATSTATSGQSNAFVATMTSTGNGKASTVGANIYVVEQGNTDYVYPVYIGTAAISNKTIIQGTGIFMYLEDMGNAVQHQVGISINRNITNVGTASDCFLEMRNHGSTDATAFVKMVGSATYLWDFDQGDQVVPISAWSSGTTVSHRAAVRLADGSARYLHLFTT